MTSEIVTRRHGDWSSRAANLAIVIAMLALAWRAVRSSSPEPGSTQQPVVGAVAVADSLWQLVRSDGERLGPDQADVSVVVFTDYQCPACRALEERVASLGGAQSSYAGAVQYRHFPLQRIHPQARVAAAMAVCADVRGVFAAMHHALFRRPDLVRAEAWHEVFTSAGLAAEADSIMACVRGGGAEDRLRADSVLAAGLALRGTPTLVTSQRLVAGVPDTATLRRWLAAASGR